MLSSNVPASNYCPGCKKSWLDGMYHCGICHKSYANQSDLISHWDEHGLCKKGKDD